MKRKKFSYSNVPYHVGGEVVGMTQRIHGSHTAYLIFVDGERKSATIDEFLAHVNAKAAEAQEEYDESCRQDDSD